MRRSTSELLIERLVQAVPDLVPLYNEHITDYDEVLPHVFFGDVVRYLTQDFSGPDVRVLREQHHRHVLKVLRILDDAIMLADPDVLELLSVSFLENIDWSTPEGQWIRSSLGPGLRQELSRRESL